MKYFVSSLIVSAMLCSPVFAQEATKPVETPKVEAPKPAQDELAKKVLELQNENAQLRQAAAATPENTAKTVDSLAADFKKSGGSVLAQGCKKSGGKSLILFDSKANVISFAGCLL